MVFPPMPFVMGISHAGKGCQRTSHIVVANACQTLLPLSHWLLLPVRRRWTTLSPRLPRQPRSADAMPSSAPAPGPVVDGTVASPPAQVSDLAVSQTADAVHQLAKDVLRHLQSGGTAKLLRSSCMRMLTNYCGLCGQWHAHSQTLKLHYRSLRAAAFQLDWSARKLAPRLGAAFNPCLYCIMLDTD